MAYKRSRYNLRPRNMRGLATAARVGYRAYKSYTRTKAKRATSSPGVTTQHDTKTIYRKKRMPRRKRKQWAKFSNKVNAVIDSAHATKTMLINNTDALTATAGSQLFASYNIYGMNGTNGAGTRGNADLVTVAANITNYKKMVYKSAILDLTFTNTSIFPIEMDVYHVRYNNEHEANTPLATFTNAANNTLVTTGTTSLGVTSRGATPWDFPLALSIARITIVKKTKVFLGPGNCSTYQIRDPRNHGITKYDINNQTAGYNYVKPGITQGVIVIAKNVAGYQASATGMSIGCTQKYSYTYISDNSVESGQV